MTLTEQPHMPEIPAELPSSLLERRPDIREAEAQLIAANAQIGSSEGSVLPSNQLDRDRRIPEFRAYQPVHWAGRLVEFRRITGTAHFRRRKDSIRRQVQ